MVEIKKQKIGRRWYSVVDTTEYRNLQKVETGTAVSVNVDGRDLVLPVKDARTAEGPGIYRDNKSPFSEIKVPKVGEEGEYASDIIDFGSSKSFEELRDKQKKYMEQDNQIFANPENITTYQITEDTSPAMAALKIAINKKKIDIDLYKDKFGANNFANIKRKLKDDDITLNMLLNISEVMGIEVSMSLKDKEGTPNPIGEEIHTILNKEEEMK